MELTQEQQAQLRQAQAAGEQRAALSFTPQQKAEWEATVQQELAGREENLNRLRRIKAAAEAGGFLGDLRLAITSSRRPVQELADEIGVHWRLLSDFRAGDAELSSAALDRLVAALGLRLMREIPQ
ncbi:MAG: hypothetical protein ACLQNE_31920 [Thermoguttaceae bacterium]